MNLLDGHGERRIQSEARSALLVGAGVAAVGLGLAWANRLGRSRDRRREAPGRPGVDPHWSRSDKAGVGTALRNGAGGDVWFTLGHGNLSEVFYPRQDHPCVRDLTLIVADDRGFVSDERDDADHAVEPLGDGVLAYRQVNTCRQGRYRIEKTTIASPIGSAVLQRVRFTALRGDPGDYRVFALLNPHMGLRQGVSSTGWTGEHKGEPILFAQRGNSAMALACSAGWCERTVGFIGASDGEGDVKRHGGLTHHYEVAREGNVQLAGAIEPASCGGEFVLALGFGPDPGEAAHHARSGLMEGFDGLLEAYLHGWREWQQGLGTLDDGDGRLYRTSAAVLRAHEGTAVPGAAIASLSIPWGAARANGNLGEGGYHMVWPRDQAEVAGGLLAAGARPEARRILHYLRATQEADGHWPQNMWVGGDAFWSSIQLGETALPLLLLDLLRREGDLSDAEAARFWPMTRHAVEYLLHFGPSSQEDRWENERGYTPYTLGALIAALLVAAELADHAGDGLAAAFLRDTADSWQDDLDRFTYVEGTKLARQTGVAGYYLRVAPPDDRGEPIKYDPAPRTRNRPGAQNNHRPADVVSVDALAYVRFGVRSPDDPRILDTLKVIDATLKVETPFGPCWRRYLWDEYGEEPDGAPFDGKSGRGRAWPLLAGERAHYELAAGRRDEADRLRRAMEGFANAVGLIPEQVWDSADIPERGLYLGRPSGSAMPLAWAHAEYLKLLRSLRDGRVFDLPPQAARRYLVEKVQARYAAWRTDLRRRTISAGKVLRIVLRGPAVVHWDADGEPSPRAVATVDSGLGCHFADLPTERLEPGAKVRFRIECAGSSTSDHVRVE